MHCSRAFHKKEWVDMGLPSMTLFVVTVLSYHSLHILMLLGIRV